MAKNFHARAAGEYIFAAFWQSLGLVLIVNVYVTLYLFFIQTIFIVSKEATIKNIKNFKNRCSQNLRNLFLKYLWKMSYIF